MTKDSLVLVVALIEIFCCRRFGLRYEKYGLSPSNNPSLAGKLGIWS